MNNTVRFAGLLIALSLLTTATLDAPYAAPRRSLRSRKAAADRGAAAARAKIHTLKKRAVAQRGKLSAAQQALQEAQGDLRQATARLRHTQAALAVVRREHQRKGYASEAIRLVLRYFFEELRYQKVNAEYLARRGAALVLEDQRLKDELLPVVRALLADPAKLDEMRRAMQSLSRPQAARDIANLLRELAARPARKGKRTLW